jgi:hypothetical protein
MDHNGTLTRNPTNGWIVASVPSPWVGGYKGWMPCMTWCQEHLDGESLDINAARSYGKNWRYVGEGVFEFRRADDHLMFLLRFS